MSASSMFVLYHSWPSNGSLVGVSDDAVYDNLFQLEATTSLPVVDSSDSPVGATYKLSINVVEFAV